jgi:hypothetical protein
LPQHDDDNGGLDKKRDATHGARIAVEEFREPFKKWKQKLPYLELLILSSEV